MIPTSPIQGISSDCHTNFAEPGFNLVHFRFLDRGPRVLKRDPPSTAHGQRTRQAIEDHRRFMREIKRLELLARMAGLMR